MTQSKAKELFDALELQTMCNETFDSSVPRPAKWAPIQWNDLRGWTIFADSVHGDDSNECKYGHAACKTVHGALYRIRKLPCRQRPLPKTVRKRCDHVKILLMAGTCEKPPHPARRSAVLHLYHPCTRCCANADLAHSCCIW